MRIKLIFTTVIALFVCISVQAQNELKAMDKPVDTKEVYRPLTKTEIHAGLSYSEDQKKVLGEHYQTYLEAMKQVRENKDLSPEEKAAAYSKVKADYKKAITSTLTEKQLESFMAVEKLREEAIKEKSARIEN